MIRLRKIVTSKVVGNIIRLCRLVDHQFSMTSFQVEFCFCLHRSDCRFHINNEIYVMHTSQNIKQRNNS